MTKEEYKAFVEDLNRRIEIATATFGGQAGYDEWYNLVKGNDNNGND